jgi:hypothetical protein
MYFAVSLLLVRLLNRWLVISRYHLLSSSIAHCSTPPLKHTLQLTKIDPRHPIILQKHIKININKSTIVRIPQQIYILLTNLRIKLFLKFLNSSLIPSINTINSEWLGRFFVF